MNKGWALTGPCNTTIIDVIISCYISSVLSLLM
jgi:hypothetical protein